MQRLGDRTAKSPPDTARVKSVATAVVAAVEPASSWVVTSALLLASSLLLEVVACRQDTYVEGKHS